MLKFVLAVLLVFGSGLSPAQAPHRSRFNFNPGWLVQTGDPANAQAPGFDDSAWKPVTLPYAWNEDSAFKVSIDKLPTGIAWYRKHFRVPAGAPGQRVHLEFEGIRMAGVVYLNGKLLGRHEDGVSAFGFDITDALKPAAEDNILAVRTDNDFKYKEIATGTAFHWNDTNFYANYGGISKNVWLHVTGPVHQTLPLFSSLGTTGTYIWAGDFDLATNSAKITAETQVRNDSMTPQTIGYTARIEDANHLLVGTMKGSDVTLAPGEMQVVSASQPVAHLHLWSWGYGYLYKVTTTISIDGKPIDAVTTTTGFRQTAFDHGELTLNGRVMQIHGYAQRTTNEWPAIGIDLPPWLSDFSNRLMVEGNANLVRWMHVTPSRQDTDSADRVGLIQSMPAGDSEGDSKGRQWEQRVELMRDSIIYNRNNPSILFYESGNKSISDEHMAEMKAVRDRYDPHGGRAIGSREMLASHVAEYGGEMLYVDKSASKPLWAHEYSRDEAARAFWDNESAPFHKDSPLYNRNQDSHAIEDVLRWDDYYRARPGTGDRVSAGGVKIIFADSNTHHRGDNNYRRSGAVDAMRLPKDGFYAGQVMWNGWVDPERPAMHILGHWSYPAGTTKTVYVVAAKVARVQLTLNGKTVGSVTASDTDPNPARALPLGTAALPDMPHEAGVPAGQSSDFLFAFPNIAFATGKLEAIGYDAAGKRITDTHLQTAGEPASIRLFAHAGPGGLHADGSDLALVDVEVMDSLGRRCPTANNMISFAIDGPAEWRGGIAQPAAGTDIPSFSNYILSRTLPVEDGINRVLIRTQPTAGKITVTATSPGLRSAMITLLAVPVKVDNGLATYDPAAALPSNLLRGPTPTGSSVHITRTSIPIVSATAGSNPDTAARAYDDNETTSWSNDGQLSTAWIDLTLKQASTPTQIDLKLNAFRTRRYPIRITLDGTPIYEGITPMNLGYTTIPLKPAQGTHLRIALTGAPIDDKPASATIEVNGKYDGAGVAPVTHDSKAILNVIEADVYQ
nr:sugar-binding domain-containing protein [Granulicella tundricola]